MRTVTSTRGRPELLERDRLEPGDPPRLGVPARAARRAARGPRRRRRPAVRIAAVPHTTMPDRLRVAPSSRVAASSASASRVPDVVGEVAGQRARVDGVDVAAGRQHVERARGSGSPTGPPGRGAPRSAADQRRDLVGRGAAAAARPRAPAKRSSAATPASVARPAPPRTRARPPRGRTPVAVERAEQRVLGVLQAVDEVAAPSRAGPGKRASSGRRRRRATRAAASAGSSRPSAAPIARRRPRPALAAGPAAAGSAAEQPAQLLALGRAAEHVQAVADLEVLDLAQVAVDVLDQARRSRRAPAARRLELEVAVQLGLVQRASRCGCAQRRAAWPGRAPPRARTRRAAARAARARRRSRRASSAARGGRRSRRGRGAWPACPRPGR